MSSLFIQVPGAPIHVILPHRYEPIHFAAEKPADRYLRTRLPESQEWSPPFSVSAMGDIILRQPTANKTRLLDLKVRIVAKKGF